MTVSILCLVCGVLLAVMGKIMQAIQQYDASLNAWGIALYIAAGVMTLVAVVEFVRTIIRLQNRKQRAEEEKAFAVLQFHNKRPINGIYVGGNQKKPKKTAATKSTGKKGVI